MEQILFAPQLNPTEFLRTLAAHGRRTLNLRIMGASELARTALMRSGISVPEEFLPRKDEAALIDTFLRKTAYFSSASFADAENMAAALFSLRSLIPENETETISTLFCTGEFEDKNKAVADVYGHYTEALKQRGLIDSIGLIRRAIAEAEPLAGTFLLLKEFPLSPLEQALADRCLPGAVTRTVPELFGTQETAAVRGVRYLKSYGTANEVEQILSGIAADAFPYDRCTVAVAETSRYAQLFYEYSLTHGIDMTFGCGIPITNSYPARLLRALSFWDTDGYHGVDALKAVLSGEALDRKRLTDALGISETRDLDCIAELLGNLKCSRDFAETQRKLDTLKPVLEERAAAQKDGVKDHGGQEAEEKLRLFDASAALGRELALGYSHFIRNYAFIRKGPAGKIDRAAVNVICEAIDAYVKYSRTDDLSELIPELLQKTVCSDPCRPGALHVTGIAAAFSSLRDRLYVAGLSADNFPGRASENYLLLDSDYELFGPKTPTSGNRIRAKIRLLEDLLKTACSLDIPVYLSYSDFNAAEISNANPSSVLFDLFRKEHGMQAGPEDFEAAFTQTGYFQSGISATDRIGLAYTGGQSLITEEIPPEPEPVSIPLNEYGYSPTSLDTYFNCPHSYLLQNILRIDDPEETDPFTVIDGKQTGTLAHTVMEWLAAGDCRPSQTEFLEKAAAVFDDFLKEYVPLHDDAAAQQKEEFLEMMADAFTQDPANEVLGAEQKQAVDHETGVRLHGIPDRVEKDRSGRCLIADFKTARRIGHVPDDIDTCLQIVAYAYMMEQLGYPVSYGEYRYLRKGKTISCKFDDEMKQQLKEKLETFRHALESGAFPVTPGEKNANCKYCTFSDICPRDNRREAEDA